MRIPGLEIGRGVEDLPWRETRVPGVSWLPLRLEESSRSGSARGGGAVLIRMEPGRGYEAHRHVGPEDVLVLQGGYRDEDGIHEAGDLVHYPAGSVHSPIALGDPDLPATESPPACILYAVVERGVELLERE